MTERPTYSVDTSALIDGLERYYPEASFPGLWEAIDDLIADGRFVVSEEVWEEAKKKDEVVKTWLEARKDEIVAPTTTEVLETTQSILVQSPRMAMSGSGRNKADPFVVAVGERLSGVVVTGEGHDGNERRPKIPYVCQLRGLRCIRFTELIVAEQWTFGR